MRLCGLQKLTALDYPGKIACTVFTPGCNFRCGFCHNAALVTAGEMPEEIAEEEVLSYLQKRKGILDGVVITGGEPLLQPDIADFIRRVKSFGYLVKLDTNGSFPSVLEKLLNENLVDYVAMDIKNSPENYAKTCGVKFIYWSNIEKSANLIMRSAPDYEFRTTAVAQLHKDADFSAMGELIKGAKSWYIQNFVDSGNLIGSGFSAPNPEDLRRWAEIASSFVEYVEIRGV